MKKGIMGNWQPECYEDFRRIEAAGGLRFHTCVSCMDDFRPDNTHTKLGWVETQISRMCEDCYDRLFADDEAADEEESDNG